MKNIIKMVDNNLHRYIVNEKSRVEPTKKYKNY